MCLADIYGEIAAEEGDTAASTKHKAAIHKKWIAETEPPSTRTASLTAACTSTERRQMCRIAEELSRKTKKNSVRDDDSTLAADETQGAALSSSSETEPVDKSKKLYRMHNHAVMMKNPCQCFIQCAACRAPLLLPTERTSTSTAPYLKLGPFFKHFNNSHAAVSASGQQVREVNRMCILFTLVLYTLLFAELTFLLFLYAVPDGRHFEEASHHTRDRGLDPRRCDTWPSQERNHQ